MASLFFRPLLKALGDWHTRDMVSLAMAVSLAAFAQAEFGPNRVVNPGFQRGMEGWPTVWSRTEGALKTEITTGRATGNLAIHVVHAGEQDWAVAQGETVSVKPGQILQLSGWMKGTRGSGVISAVLRDSKGDVLDWSFAAKGPTGNDWVWVKRKAIIPDRGASIQFRLIGSRPGEVWLQSPTLTLGTGPLALPQASVTLRAGRFRTEVQGDGSLTTTTPAGRRWSLGRLPTGFILQKLTLTHPDVATAQVWSVEHDLQMTVTMRQDRQTGDVDLRWEGNGGFEGRLPACGPVVTQKGMRAIVPMNEGIGFPVGESALSGWELITYGGHGLCMPWSGVQDDRSGAGMMMIVKTPDDADVRYSTQAGLLTFQPQWEPSRGQFGYARSLKLCFFEKGGYVAMAKRYRAYAKQVGLFKTLRQKQKENPNVDRLIGAANIWNWDMDKVALCKELRSLGFKKVLWSGGGAAAELRTIGQMGYLPGVYDIYQDVWDPNNSLTWQLHEGWPEDLVLEPSGEWMKGWAHPDKQADGTVKWYQGGVICSSRGLLRAKKKIPADLKVNPYLARFIDTTTASPFRECYNPAHPLTRSQDRGYKMQLLDFCSKDMKLVTGTETGIDPSVPFVHYYEGMMSLGPYRLPDSGTDMMAYRKPTEEFLKYQVGPRYRLPLWELVYHDCTVAGWYWGDAANKAPEVWKERDLLNILYGTPPLLMFDRAKWNQEKTRMAQTYRDVCEWVSKVGYDEMVSHQDLTRDHFVQKTTWSSGRSVIVNFGKKPYRDIPGQSFKASKG